MTHSRGEKVGNLSIFKRQYDWIIRKTVHQFVEYMASRRMKGIETLQYEQKTNPLRGWALVELKGMQNAPQETEMKLCDWWYQARCEKDQFKKFKL